MKGKVMTEEPKLDEAFRKLMGELDKGIQPALAVTRKDELVAESIIELESSLLDEPTPGERDEALRVARIDLKNALYRWIEVNNGGL